MSISKKNPWLYCPNPDPAARLRLVCFPFAGGGASVFNSWSRALPPGMEVHGVQLPGRESRFVEPRVLHVEDAVIPLVETIENLADRPLVFFGYSLGALLAYETAVEFSRLGKGTVPARLLVAAARAPHIEDVVPPLAQLPDDLFLEKVNYYYEPSDESWKVPELLQVLLPILRDDIQVSENYGAGEPRRLQVPITVFAGEADRSAPRDSIEAWKQLTDAGCRIEVYPGGHFFINQHLGDIQRRVGAELTALLEDG